ncbi:uncharacterized protein LOC116306089 [Actinia tenebrosa]|uniref:Uncharacterized protein LOC116306089 n=1 Tax=Actinia tenebrosa TaxID=6105 RepID=A0A6P8IXX6_ACTTE|nr:uncharacterized protein LOC116306089 [Actinia tenebrosa]XP_031571983.1 uncharacterized protein LOC116306089 [Actinia tenebrosa]
MRRNKRVLLFLLAGMNALIFFVLHFNMTEFRPLRDHYKIYKMVIKEVFLERTNLKDTSILTSEENARRLMREETETEGYFPVDGRNICPYLGIRKIPYFTTRTNSSTSNTYCKLRVPSKVECKKAYKSYGIGEKAEKCQEENNKKDLCYFTHINMTTTKKVNLKCDLTPCGKNSVFVASIDPRNGELEDKAKWKEFFQVAELEASLPEIIEENFKNGFQFCFLSCLSASGSNTIETLLMFPPRIPRKNQASVNSVLNINVVVLDSVSRPHFYRSLPKTVKALREISYNDSLDAMVLDYELFQSIGPYTYINMKAFFTGNSLYHAEKSVQINSDYQYYYGFDVFYRKLKEKGFYTLLQEDLCWYDVWGTVMGNTRKDFSKDRDAKDRIKRWRRLLQDIKNSYIDDTGITHATCNVLNQYGVTNPFTKPKKICYAGKVFIQYFLDYLDKVFSQSNGLKERSSRIFAYTHFNVGHENTGRRIQQADESLSKYLRKMAEDQSTLTLVFSDHGPKTTDYSIHSLEGMYELYNPFMFIIMPEKIASIIGAKRIRNLINNQKRVITLKDVHGALTSILEFDYNFDKLAKPVQREGIFSAIPEHRQICTYETLCICKGNEKWFSDNDAHFTWVAEFAIGELNNQIQRLYSMGMRNTSTVGGFGNCQRLVGKRFKKVHLREDDKNFFVTMDITTSPVNVEFQVHVKYPKTPASFKRRFTKKTLFARLLNFRRLTTYQDYHECKDPYVSIQLCVCKRSIFNNAVERGKSSMWKWTTMDSPKAVHEVMRRQGNLGANQKIVNLDDSDCLYLISRSYANQTLVYEVGNACTERRYMVHFTGHSVSKVQPSVSFPFTVDVKPLTLHFILTVYHYRKPFDFKPLVTFRIHSY